MGSVRVPVILRLIGIAAGLALATAVSSCSDARGPARAARGTDLQPSSIVGLEWRIAEVRRDASSVTIPREQGGSFALSADGGLVADDTLNNYAARFTATTTGFHVTNTTSSGAGYAGHDPIMLALIDGTRALTGEGADVVARRVGTQLDLSVGRYHLVAVPVGPVAAAPSPAPSPTGTRS
jgi:hypothetical protein